MPPVSPWGSMASILMHFSSEAFLPGFHMRVRRFRGKDFILVIYSSLSLSGANHAVCVFHLPCFSSNYLLLDFSLCIWSVGIVTLFASLWLFSSLCHVFFFILVSSLIEMSPKTYILLIWPDHITITNWYVYWWKYRRVTMNPVHRQVSEKNIFMIRRQVKPGAKGLLYAQ